MREYAFLTEIRSNIFLILAFGVGFAIPIVEIFKPYRGGLWKIPSDAREKRQLFLSVLAALVAVLFMFLHIYYR